MAKRTNQVAPGRVKGRKADAVIDRGTINGMRYVGLEIVRLKQNHLDSGLNSGDCGVVWGVYGIQPEGPYSYEATFVNEHGEWMDMMFEEDDVEEVRVEAVAQMPHPERLLEALEILHRATDEAIRAREA